MTKPITRQMFMDDAQGRTFTDVVEDQNQPFDAVLAFFRDESRIRRMEESEFHHDRPPLAGVVPWKADAIVGAKRQLGSNTF